VTRQRRTARADERLRFELDDDDDDEFMTTIISAWHTGVSPPVFILKMSDREGGCGGEGEEETWAEWRSEMLGYLRNVCRDRDAEIAARGNANWTSD